MLAPRERSARLPHRHSLRLIDRLAFFDSLDDLDVLDRHVVNRQRVLVEDNEVSQLAGLERTLGVLLGRAALIFSYDDMEC